MKAIKPFAESYPDYYRLISEVLYPGIRICEVGPSGKPSYKKQFIKDYNLNYTIIDIEDTYWTSYDPSIPKFKLDLQQGIPDGLKGKFDLVISQMVLEHINDAESFHRNVLNLLDKNGEAIHIYANPYSISALVNRALPDHLGEAFLRWIKSRNIDKDHKYVAYYNKCFSNIKKSSLFYSKLGFQVESHTAYLGHNYFQYIPVFKQMELFYSWILYQSRLTFCSTLSLIHVTK